MVALKEPWMVTAKEEGLVTLEPATMVMETGGPGQIKPSKVAAWEEDQAMPEPPQALHDDDGSGRDDVVLIIIMVNGEEGFPEMIKAMSDNEEILRYKPSEIAAAALFCSAKQMFPLEFDDFVHAVEISCLMNQLNEELRGANIEIVIFLKAYG
ncbi:uncharacterized protein A4U43_C03F19210 [Asparagus officinalis]|uniref:Cyclin C-terminal domain-containing protein n=1 Tax=Asparagus officinalis TaxID=4686 RepID=A0A5P1FGG4_ASPOF|nr:uncharacterized protein A4U43_C03F19210 [Asparagus officinalis]